MKTGFKYILDPIFLLSTALYTLNKLMSLPTIQMSYKFTRFYLNDVLLVPVLVPLILFSSRLLGLRPTNAPPSLIEIGIPLVIWSITFEVIAPYFWGEGYSDPFDILAYCAGGVISWGIWNRS